MASDILWLSHETPDRHGQGGQRRQYFQIRALVQAGHRVHVLSLRGPQSESELRQIASVERHRSHVLGRRLPDLVNLVRRRVESGRWDRVVLAHADSLDMLEPFWDRPPLLIDLHNVYSRWFERQGEHGIAARQRHLERLALRMADTVSVCSDREMERLLGHGDRAAASVIVLPNGVDPQEWPEPVVNRELPVVAAFGGWAWRPNMLGLQWFLSDVWPGVRAAVPDAQFHLAGTGLDWLDVPAPGLVALGRVPNLAAHLAAATVVVTPVLDGVGSPVKFAESLASGARVAATPDAASAAPGSPAFVSGTAGEWIAWIGDQLQQRKRLPVPAPEREYALQNLTWSRVTAGLDEWLRA